MYKIYYCPRCGWNTLSQSDSCDFCGYKTKIIEINADRSTAINILRKTIKESPDFEQSLYDKSLEYYQMLYESQNSSALQCPYCHSTNVRKVGDLERAVSSSLLGVGSPSLGKQWYCMNCDSFF